MNVRTLAGMLAAAALAWPAAAGAQAPAQGMSAAEAEAELRTAVAAFQGDRPAGDPTVALRDLFLALPALDGSSARRARSILARPTDGPNAEPFGGGWPLSAVERTSDTAHFKVHWPEIASCNRANAQCDEPDLTDVSPDDGIPDYINRVRQAAEASFNTQNTILGWPLAKPDGTKGGDSKVDIYIADICHPEGALGCVYGYAAPDDNSAQCQTPPFKCAAYLVLDNDYQFSEFGYADTALPLRVTTTHEYNHVLQFNLDTIQDGWMFESTAVWAEERTFPADDDYLFYVNGSPGGFPGWVAGSTVPITDFGGQGGLRVYGSGVWNHFLSAMFGHDSVLRAWQKSRQSNPKDYAVGAYDLSIRDEGGGGFSQQFVNFAAATSEWRTAGSPFAHDDAGQLTDVRRRGALDRGDGKSITLDHTAYRLLSVDPGSANELRLKVRAPDNVRSGIALVGRDGDPTTGAVVRKVKFLSDGGRGSVRLQNAQSFERITAVLVNADGRVNGFGGADWNYTRDNERFKLNLG